MKLSKFYRTIKYKGTLTVIMTSIQYKFTWIEHGVAKVEISTKAGINEKLTKEIGFEIDSWKIIDFTTYTATAWHMYENIKVNGNVLLKLKDVDKEYWLEKNEI